MVVGIIGLGLAGWAAWAFLGDDGGDGGSRTAPPPEPSATSAEPDFPKELARFYEQDLDWRDCGANQCSRLEVPLDYSDPDGKVIELAVLRAPAKQRDKRVGSRGEPGRTRRLRRRLRRFRFVQLGDKLIRYFDIVGFDPRGVATSDPLECLTDRADRRVPRPTRPRTPRPRSRRIGRSARGEGCAAEADPPWWATSTPSGGPGHRRAAGRPRRQAAVLPRQVLRHLPGCDVRRPLPDQHRSDGAGRRHRPVDCRPASSTSARRRGSSRPPARSWRTA